MITLLQTLVTCYRMWRTARAHRWLAREANRIAGLHASELAKHPEWVQAHARGHQIPGVPVHVTDDTQKPGVEKQAL